MNKYLLDTQVLLWWLEDDGRLKRDITKLIIGEENQVFVSVISFWEISVKNRLGKLPLRTKLETIVNESKFTILSITTDYILALDALPLIHKDPFDRMLVAQAKVEKLKLITSDPKIWKYKVAVLKA